jgi:hypothetical protein
MWLILENPILYLRIWVCVPSPQSIKKNRPRTLSTWAVGYLFDVGNAELVPRIVSRKGVDLSDIAEL